MKRIVLTVGMLVILMASWLFVPQSGHADVEWTVKNRLDLKVPPLDIAVSADEQWIFILAPGEILVYSAVEDKVVKHIPLSQDYDTLKHSAKNNTLILSSRSRKTVKIIQLGLVPRITISGLPFQGPEHAPVTIVVFTDYQ